MNRKLAWLVLVAALQGVGGAVVAYGQNAGGAENGAGPAPQTKPAPKPRIRWPKPLKLPDQYRSRDSDKDGQIGLYEWPRTDYATFRKLDLNRDGFLTPQELTRGPSTKPPGPVAAAPVAPAKVAPVADAVPSAASADGAELEGDESSPAPATTKAPPASVPAAPASNSDAERQWDLLDKDKDGKVTEEEWGKSLFTRPKFRDAGVAVSFPLARDEFIRLYQQVVPSSAK